MDDYLRDMTPDELELETSKRFDYNEDKNSKESIMTLSLEPRTEEDRGFNYYEELMGIGVDPDELSQRALRTRKLRARKHIDETE
jgi:hypothetical protein